jgi:hypothetical protein
MATELLASNFGNLWAFMFVLPPIGLLILIAFLCWLTSVTAIQRLCGVGAIALSVVLVLSAGDAREGDAIATVSLGFLGGVLGLVFLRAGPDEKEPDPPRHS